MDPGGVVHGATAALDLRPGAAVDDDELAVPPLGTYHELLEGWPMTSVMERVAAGELVVIDGGTGTEIQRRGGAMDDATWCAEANLQRPDLVREVHRAYLEAGAELIIANTFATSPLLFATLGRDDEVATDRPCRRPAGPRGRGRRRGGRGRLDLDHAAGGGRR